MLCYVSLCCVSLCCVSFKGTEQWFSYICLYIYYFSDSFPLYVNLKLLIYLPRHALLSPVAISYQSHKFVFYVWESISALWKSSFVSFFFLDSTYKQYHMIFVFVCFTSLSVMISRCCKWHYFIPFYGWVVFYCLKWTEVKWKSLSHSVTQSMELSRPEYWSR